MTTPILPFASPGRVVARSYAATDEVRYAAYEVSLRGAKIVAQQVVPATERAVWLAALRAADVRVGGMYGGNSFVWLCDDRGYVIWRGEDGGLVTGQRAELADVVGVRTFIGDDYVERGVLLDLRDGGTRPLVQETDLAASVDPSYTANEFMMSDAKWCLYCARDLARWLGVPLHDDAFGTSPGDLQDGP
ncbi:MAG: hypothetical protein NT062_17380 [Proteobacteria bacterium]|nr:hypothetical protein [Pseudomonadota bacterium]